MKGLSKSTEPWLAPWGETYGFGELGIEGLVNFCEYVFLNKPAAHHAAMMLTALEGVVRRRHTVDLEPRGAAKTTYLNTGFGSWIVGMYPDIRIGLISNTATQSSDFSRAIRWTVESNPRWREIFGNGVSTDKWTNAEWLHKRSKWHGSKDVTVFATGVGGAILSKRFDLIIADDILDEENTATPEAREKVETWWWKTLMPCLAPDGVVLVIGTRWAEEDLYERLMTPVRKGGKGWYSHVRSAIIDDQSYWPEYWTMEKLDTTRADLGSALFMCAYMNDIRGLMEGNIFRSADWKRDDFYFDHLSTDHKYTIRMGVDLASSEKERADFTARATVAEDDNGDFWILSIYRDKRESGHAEFVKDGWEVYPNIALVIVENQAFQSTLVVEVMEDYPWIPIEGRRSDVDKVTRARALAAKYEAGKMHHHSSLKGSDFELELLGFPKGHDDMIDAVGFACDLGGGGGLIFGSARR